MAFTFTAFDLQVIEANQDNLDENLDVIEADDPAYWTEEEWDEYEASIEPDDNRVSMDDIF